MILSAWEFENDAGVFVVQRMLDGGYELEHYTERTNNVSYHLSWYWVHQHITTIVKREKQRC